MTALVTDPVRWWAQNIPDSPAIVFDGRETLTYSELDQWTDNVATALAQSGVGIGERVGVVGPNSLEWCAAAIGALKAGAIVAAYNHRLVGPELTYMISDSDPSVVIADEGHAERLAEVRDAGSRFDVIAMKQIADLRIAPHATFDRLDVEPDQPAVIVYTSGTTANPKGVVFTHRTTLSFIAEWGLMEPAYRHGARMIFLLSLGGAPGLLWAVLHMAARGGVLFLEHGFDAKVALERLERERIEVMMGVPVLFEQIAALPEFEHADLSSLASATVGGARVSRALLESWLAKGVTLRQIYGMTELGGTATANTIVDAVRLPESVGRGSIFTRLRVVRPDGTDCDPGEPGEIIARGPSVTPGYWRNPEATAEAIRGGWFHSGDIGIIDADGHLRMVDRLKDMIITGGYNVAPSEIESVIAELQGVEEVAVISVDDEKFGETPAAVIRVSEPIDPQAVVDACRARLAAYKVPRYVVVHPEPLPRMPSGKIAKRVLRETYSDVPSTHEKLR